MSHHEALKQQGDVIWNIANLLRGPYEIPFNRHFYEYVPPRPLEAIEALERDIMAMLREVTA
jgi:type I restriction enzyme M protein